MIFYVLDTVAARHPEEGYCNYTPLGKRRLGDFALCPHCNGEIASKPWLPPYNVMLNGKRFGDLCVDVGRTLLVSDRFASAWREAGLTGFEFRPEPIDVRTQGAVADMQPPGYTAAIAAAKVTRLDEAASGLEASIVGGCEQCRTANRKKVERIRVDESSWDGVDAFYPSGLFGELFVTERAADLIRTHGFTNFPLIHQDDYREDRDS